MPDNSYIPDFDLKIDGEPIPAEMRASLTSISHTTGLEGADRVELALANESMRWLDHPLLTLDTSVELSLGYAGELTRLFVGEITGREARFPSSSLPTLNVVAQDARSRLIRGRKVRWFCIPIPSVGNIPLPDMVTSMLVSAENGLLPIYDPVGAAISVILMGVEAIAIVSDPAEMQRLIRKQLDESDYDFLHRIAAENGWEMMVDHSGPLGGHMLRFFSPLGHLSEDASFRYGESLIEFTPRVTSVGQLFSVTAFIFISEIKMTFSVTVGFDWDRMSLTLSIIPAIVPLGQEPDTAFLIKEPVTPVSAPREIFSRLLPALNNRLTGSGSVVGDPRLVAGAVVRLDGLGREFGGLWRITQARHGIDSGGYVTRFEARKELWFGSIPMPEQGAFPIVANVPFVP